MNTTTDDHPDYRGSQPRSMRELSEWHARAPVAAALEPELPIVDPHHHLFGASTDRHFYRLEDLGRDLDSGHRIIGTVYVEAYDSGWRKTGPHALRPVGEVEMIAGLTKAPLQIAHGPCQVAAAIVAHADLTLGDGVVDVLEAELEAAPGRMRGVRHRTATDDGAFGSFIVERPRPHLLRDPAFRKGFAHLRRFGLSFDAWIYHTQLDELIELADEFPETPIVLDHVGGPIGVAQYRPKHAEVLEHWRKGVRALAARPNVHVKVGGMGMTMFGFGFEGAERPATAGELAAAWQPCIEFCVDAFGTSRCMFESNFPVDKQSCSYVELWNAFKLATRGWSREERSDLFHRTACRIYRLPELARIADRAG